jgi:hypothetical protein
MLWHGRFSWCARRRNRFRRADVRLDGRWRASRRRYYPFWLLFALKLDCRCRNAFNACTACAEDDVQTGRAQHQSHYCPHSHAPLYAKYRTLRFLSGATKCHECFQHRFQIQHAVQQYGEYCRAALEAKPTQQQTEHKHLADQAKIILCMR